MLPKIAALLAVSLLVVSLLLPVGGPSHADWRPIGRGLAVEGRGLAVRPASGRVVRAFDPPATRYGAGHRGVDLAAHPGEPIVAALGGTVTFAGDVAGVSWVTVDHGGGLTTTYGPVAPRIVRAGSVVSAGEVVGFVAAGARHLDWGARFDDAYIDPLSLLSGWETYLTSADDTLDLPALGGTRAARGASSTSARALVLPARGVVTSGFGHREHPVTGRQRLHAGIDIGAPTGRAVVAAAAGIVAFAGEVSGYGQTVIVDHGGGVTTLYAHQSAIDVAVGASVAAGQRLGRVGSTGLSTGPHLHFEVRVDGAPVNPAGWLGS